MMIKQSGTIYIVSAPSGAGKTSLVRAVTKEDNSIIKSISYTTRPERQIEQNGKDYEFVTAQEFRDLIKQNKLLEYAEIYGHFYGTSKERVEQSLRDGKDVILEIDWKGARQA